MNDIILIAIQEEAPALAALPNIFFTGVGKVNAALSAARLIEKHRPQRIWNFGTAGGITVEGGLHRCTRFLQRDMLVTALGYPDQRWLRTDADGQTEIWSYTSYDAYDGVPLFRGDYHRYNGGFPLYSDHFFNHQARAREYLKVSFKGELVNSIEQDARR